MSDYISEEVLIEILKRLPVKSLIKFRCVCKSWYFLITSFSFISTHLTQSLESARTYTIFQKKSSVNPYNNEQILLHNDDGSFSEYRRFNLPFVKYSKHSRFKIVGSCHGLVCVFDSYFSPRKIKHRILYLWNPSVREYVTIFSEKPLNYLVGFGFDFKENDYKVVLVRRHYPFRKSSGSFVNSRIEIYKLSSNSWRTVTVENFRYDFSTDGYCFNFNGFLHWIARNPSKQTIVSFNLSDERVDEITLPEVLVGMEVDPCLDLIVCSQFLSLVRYGSSEGSFTLDGNCAICDIWVMKEYGISQSWAKLYTLDLGNHGGTLRVFGLTNNDVILFGRDQTEIGSYDLEAQRVNYHEDISYYEFGSKVDFYAESLVLLNGVLGEASALLERDKNRKN